MGRIRDDILDRWDDPEEVERRHQQAIRPRPYRKTHPQDTIDALVAALEGISWKSADRDNMEFAARITCYQMDVIRAALALARKGGE